MLVRQFPRCAAFGADGAAIGFDRHAADAVAARAAVAVGREMVQESKAVVPASNEGDGDGEEKCRATTENESPQERQPLQVEEADNCCG